MKVISGNEFLEILYSIQNNFSTEHTSFEISDYVIESQNNLNIDFDKIDVDYNKIYKTIIFKNLIFKTVYLNIHNGKNRKPSLFISNCVFETKLYIHANFDSITFNNNIFKCEKLNISGCKIERLSFRNQEKSYQEKLQNSEFDVKLFEINSSEIYDFTMENISFVKESIVSFDRINFSFLFNIQNIYANQITVQNCDFLEHFEYYGQYNISKFTNCNFVGPSSFTRSVIGISLNLEFINCNFSKNINLNNFIANKFELIDTTFKEKISFQETNFNIIKIDRTIFEKGALFDDIQIKKIDDCDRRTIRAIKQELQKAENRIDFNRFRAYELASHYKELDWKWNTGFIDKSILFVTKISTDFGNSWRKALRFTIVGGFSIYVIFYIIENRNFQIGLLNLDNWARLFSGFFRFLLVTDFYNPLETDRIYLTNPFSWLIFIFGKIVIAFGIYEMIQSFRKFKV